MIDVLNVSGIGRRKTGLGAAPSCIKRRLTTTSCPDSPKIGAGYPRRRSDMDRTFEQVDMLAIQPTDEADNATAAEGDHTFLQKLTMAAIGSGVPDKVELLYDLQAHWQAAPDQYQESELVSALLGKLADEIQLVSLSNDQASVLQIQKESLQATNAALQTTYNQLSAQHLETGLQNAQLEADCARLEREKKAAEEAARKEQALAHERDEVHREELAAAAAEKARLLAECCRWMKRAKTLEQIGWQCGAWEYAAREVARAQPGPPPRIEWPHDGDAQVAVPTVTVEEICDLDTALDLPQSNAPVKPANLLRRLRKTTCASEPAGMIAGNSKPARWWRKTSKNATPEINNGEATDSPSSSLDKCKPKTLGKKTKKALCKLGRWLSKRSQ